MKLANRFAPILFLILPLAVGCIGVESDHPVCSPTDAVPLNQNLIGIWEHKDAGQWKISPAGEGYPNTMYKLSFVDRSSVEEVGVFYVAKIGEYKCVNVASFDEGPLPKKWSPKKVIGYNTVAYQQTGDQLEIILTDNTFLLEMAKTGVLKVAEEEVGQQGIESEIADAVAEEVAKELDIDLEEAWLTNSTAELNPFAKKNSARFFGGKRKVLKRVK